MELVFFYVNLSSNGFIEKQGFNFSPNYFFEVDYRDGKYILSQKYQKRTIPKNFFDESGCISNITAIVGENGTGKTTLLECLLQSGSAVKKEKRKDDYIDYFMEQFEYNKQIAIYKDGEELICYHNIDDFTSNLNIETVYLYSGSKQLREIISKNLEFRNISKISLTNSMYAKSNLSTHNRIDTITLNTNSLTAIKNTFYNTKIKFGKPIYGGFYEIAIMLSEYRTVNEFQQMLDVLYLNHIRNKNDKSIFVNILKHDLTISFQRIDKYLERWLEEKYDVSDEESNDVVHNKEEVALKKYYRIWKECISSIEIEAFKEDIFCVAYANLLFELIADKHITEYNNLEKIDSKTKLKQYIEKTIKEIGKQKKLTNYQYFLHALEEIKEYEECLKKCSMYPCLLPKRDLAYISCKEIIHQTETYNKILNLIETSMLRKKQSFVLKYINIGGLKLSSGERALLNFFSWIYLVPYFKEINDDIEDSLFENVLLLIDEVDLYCHPKWQQKLINHLIQEIKVYFKGKNVQIIFTTHSPIVLSDIPKSNIIYLQQREGKCFIDDKVNHSETFGANIYKLFDDAFFLEKQGKIGEFSKNKIQNIIKKIIPLEKEASSLFYPKLNINHIDQLEKEISLIGEPIIRDKLFSMLYKCKYRDMDVKTRKIKLYEERIKQLKGEN